MKSILQSLLNALPHRHNEMGVTEGRLRGCPEGSRNCVSSEETHSSRKIEPLLFEDAPEQAWRRLTDVVRSRNDVEVIKMTESYLQVEFISPTLAFTDDAEFFLDPHCRAIQVRSLSRLGRRDFETNRKRLEEIRQAFKSR